MKMNSHKMRKIFGVSISLILINMAAIMERADENLLPAVYEEVSEAFNVGPSDLGYLTFIRNLVQGLASPLAGVLALKFDRPRVIAVGTFCWSLSTAAVGLSQQFLLVAFWRALNGLGLAIVIPSLQSYVADSYREGVRGTGFGLLNLMGYLGGTGGGALATVMAGQQFWGIPGWRCAFVLMAALGLVIGFLVFVFVVDPRNAEKITHWEGEDSNREPLIGGGTSSVLSIWSKSIIAMKAVMKITTFQLIVSQGVVGSVPWAAIVFLTMWFELIGFDNNKAAALVSLFSIGCGGGNLIGGLISDRLSRDLPNSGRIICAQFSAFIGIPFALVLFRMIPQSVNCFSAFAVTLLFMGLTISWNGYAVNAPMFAEVVPIEHRTMIYAFDRAFEVSVSSFGAPLVGILAERIFGYDSKSIDPDKGSTGEALALSKGLLAMISIPFGLCGLIYSPLYVYFRRDREKVRSANSNLEALQ